MARYIQTNNKNHDITKPPGSEYVAVPGYLGEAEVRAKVPTWMIILGVGAAGLWLWKKKK